MAACHTHYNHRLLLWSFCQTHRQRSDKCHSMEAISRMIVPWCSHAATNRSRQANFGYSQASVSCHPLPPFFWSSNYSPSAVRERNWRPVSSSLPANQSPPAARVVVILCSSSIETETAHSLSHTIFFRKVNFPSKTIDARDSVSLGLKRFSEPNRPNCQLSVQFAPNGLFYGAAPSWVTHVSRWWCFKWSQM